MPCTDYMGPGDNFEVDARAAQEKVDRLTALLCRLGATRNIDDMEFQDWYTAHKRADAIREQNEAQAQAAAREKVAQYDINVAIRNRLRQQLTAEERRAINL